MKVQITRNVGVSGQHLGKGEVHDLPEADATYLIRQGKATEAIEAPACPPKPKAKKPKVTTDGAE
tara:strand:+ start:1027 stop:1221 length:195 start_codon:yes stop_codon:yes gene_type:complete